MPGKSEMNSDLRDKFGNGEGHKINVSVTLTGEQAAAVEGWRAANRLESQADAVRELVRIGLLTEIGRIYRRICRIRDNEEAIVLGGDPSG